MEKLYIDALLSGGNNSFFEKSFSSPYKKTKELKMKIELHEITIREIAENYIDNPQACFLS